MLEFLFNFLSLLVFIAGILAGEVLANRAFGKPRSALVFMLDLVLVILLISLLYTYLEFYTQHLFYYLINFVLGMLSITIVRALEWLLRLTEQDVLRTSNVVELIRILAHAGLDTDEIGNCLKRLGLPQKALDKHQGLIETSVPPYIPRLVKLEKRVAGLETGLKRAKPN